MTKPLPWSKLGAYFADEDKARLLLESMRWPDGPKCPSCKSGENVYRMTRRADSVKPGRKGLLRCRPCKRQFTVTTGSVFEDSHVKPTLWLQAIYLLTSSKKGMSAHQLHRMLGVQYKTAWFMFHRLRYAMSNESTDKLSGIVEIDETYIGGRRRLRKGETVNDRKNAKIPVVALVERGGRVRAMPMERVTAETLGKALREHVSEDSTIHTDELMAYRKATEGFAGHETTTHSAHEYVRGTVHSNSVEGFFSLLKRGINGVYHHVGKGHLSKYCDEFSFRYDSRKVSDAQRAELLVWGAEGKRLTYQQPDRTGEA